EGLNVTTGGFFAVAVAFADAVADTVALGAAAVTGAVAVVLVAVWVAVAVDVVTTAVGTTAGLSCWLEITKSAIATIMSATSPPTTIASLVRDGFMSAGRASTLV